MKMSEMSKNNWKEKAKEFFMQCYECDFDQEHEFEKGKSLCQVIGFAMYGSPDEEIDEEDENKFGYSKADHILKIQSVIHFQLVYSVFNFNHCRRT